MTSLALLANENNALYNLLIENECKLYKNGKVIFEGLWDDETSWGKYANMEPDKIVMKSMINEKEFVCTLEHNSSIDEMMSIINDKELDEALKDPKTYNKLVYVSNNLPVLNIVESKDLKNKSLAYKTLFENYIVAKNDEMYEHYDQLGHDLKLGDFIQFKARAVKPMLYGQIQEISEGDKPKYKVRVLGWYGDESLKSEIKKDFYEIDVNSKHIFQLNFKNQDMVDKLKKDGILI